MKIRAIINDDRPWKSDLAALFTVVNRITKANCPSRTARRLAEPAMGRSPFAADDRRTAFCSSPLNEPAGTAHSVNRRDLRCAKKVIKINQIKKVHSLFERFGQEIDAGMANREELQLRAVADLVRQIQQSLAAAQIQVLQLFQL